MHNYNAPDYTRQAGEMEASYEGESFQGEYENNMEYETEQEDEWETEHEGTFNEAEQNELVNEMPSGESEAELDHFIQKLLHRAVGKRKLSSDANMARTLRRLLKGLSKRLFRTRRRAGHRFTHSVGEVNGSLQSEVFANENEFEARRKFVRMAGSAARRAFNMRRNQSAAYRARLALKGAAGQHLPALLRLRRYHRHSKNLALRLGRLESSLMSLAEKISSMKPNENTGASNDSANGQNSPAPAEGGDSEYEYEWEQNEYEENEYGQNEYEENEYEENEYEENEYEDAEYEDNEYEQEENEEEYEEEYENAEYEDNEYETSRPEKGSCGCKSCSTKSAQKEYEDNEYEDNEYEENEYEENEYQNEYEENEYEENEFESEFESEYGDREATFNETVQMELASELLTVQSEYELDQFLGKLIKKASRAVKKIAKVAIPGPLGGLLKKLAKQALPIAGGIVGGTFAPGIGNMLGGKLGGAAANLFELELEGLSNEDREFEKAKAFVRFAGNAVNRSTMLRKNQSPVRRAKVAFRHAARRYAPGVLRNRRRVINRRRPVQRRRNMQHPRRRPQWRKPQYRQPQHGQPQFPQQNYPVPGGALQGNEPDNFPDHTSGDTGMLNSKMDSLERVIQQLNERVASLSPNDDTQAPGANGPSGGSEGGADNEYWN